MQGVFIVTAATKYGERIAVAGSVKELGGWSLSRCVDMSWSRSCWNTSVLLQNYESCEWRAHSRPVCARGLTCRSRLADDEIEYKYVKYLANGKVEWEPGANRVLRFTKDDTLKYAQNLTFEARDTWGVIENHDISFTPTVPRKKTGAAAKARPVAGAFRLAAGDASDLPMCHRAPVDLVTFSLVCMHFGTFAVAPPQGTLTKYSWSVLADYTSGSDDDYDDYDDYDEGSDGKDDFEAEADVSYSGSTAASSAAAAAGRGTTSRNVPLASFVPVQPPTVDAVKSALWILTGKLAANAKAPRGLQILNTVAASVSAVLNAFFRTQKTGWKRVALVQDLLITDLFVRIMNPPEQLDVCSFALVDGTATLLESRVR